jgi:Glycosyl transferase family 2
MVESLVESQRTLASDRIALFMLLQNCQVSELASVRASMPAFIRPVAVPGRVPLSTARNILLRQLTADNSIPTGALVAFPDDDCWYPPGFLAQLTGLFARDPELDFWFCRYGSQPSEARFAQAEPGAARTAEVVRNASSNTIFLRGRVVNAIGEFDERLGVGTPMGGAEDLDYALRAHRAARKTAYWDGALVGHRDKSPELLARYYASGLFVLARHARGGASNEFHRKIAVGIYYALRRRLTPTELGQALRQAFVERSKAKTTAALRSDR